MASHHGGRWLAGVTLVALILCAALPQTGWLVRQQLTQSFTLPDHFTELVTAPFTGPDVIYPTVIPRWISARYRMNCPIQLAIALRTHVEQEDRMAALCSLANRFPDHPSAYAAFLRYSCYDMRIQRTDDVLSWTGGDRPGYQDRLPPVEQFALFDRAAAAGERLDPQNAFFPLIRALGLFAVRHDREAVGAILRAGTRPGWNEYLQDEFEGADRVGGLILGHEDAINNAFIDNGTPLEHNAAIRALARMATSKAISIEIAASHSPPAAQRSGRMEAFRIRAAIMHCGSLMRVESPSLVGSLIGIALTAVAMGRPGGAPWPTVVNSSQRLAVATDAYCHYLVENGHPDEANWVREEVRRGVRVRAMLNPALELTDREGLFPLMGWWTVSLALLSGSLWLILLWLTGVVRWRWGRSVIPIIVVCQICVVGAAASALEPAPRALQALWEKIAPDGSSILVPDPLAACALWALASMLPSILLLAWLIVWNLLRKRDFVEGLLQGLRVGGGRLACLFLLAYVLVASVAACRDSAGAARIQQLHNHEGPPTVALVGGAWPGRTPEPRP